MVWGEFSGGLWGVMAECKYCGAEVVIGLHCAYCGRLAEPIYYSDYDMKKDIPPVSYHPISIKVNTWYEVVSGDTLWSIAKRVYGRGSLYTHILKYNRIKNANLIYVGQRIYIPPYEEDKSVYKEKDSDGKYCLDDDLPPMGGFHD